MSSVKGRKLASFRSQYKVNWNLAACRCLGKGKLSALFPSEGWDFLDFKTPGDINLTKTQSAIIILV